MSNPISTGRRKRVGAAPPDRAAARGGGRTAEAEPDLTAPPPEQRRPTDDSEHNRTIPDSTTDAEPHDPAGPRPHPFSAEIDLSELDSRFRPGLSWSGRAVEISRSQIGFRSRRMCYEGRRILIAVHLIDAAPVALYGEVVNCEYDGEGLYRTELALMNVPELEVISSWIASRAARGSM